MSPSRSRRWSWMSVLVIILVPAVILSLALRIASPRIHRDSQLRWVRDRSLLGERGNPVAMLIDSTAHYRINDSDSDEEYRRLLPSGGHLIYMENRDGNTEEYTETLFHQLKCLDIIRQQYLKDASAGISPLTRHCMNYLHQSLLCNLNVGLENAKNSAATASRSYNALCFDWTKVYAEAERNFEVRHAASTAK